MIYIDTHAHLYGEEFDRDRQETLERAKEAGVSRIILPDIDSTSRPAMLALSETDPSYLFPLIGLHPTSVNADYRPELREVVQQLGQRTFYGIGECGLDFYWDKTYYREQIKVFEYQLGIARDARLPVVIHSRDALDEVFHSLEKYPELPGILHCFPGNEEDARRACDRGLLLGIGGVVTFKNNSLASVIRKVGIQNLVLETDAPYLAPVPYRGKRNESSYIPLIARKISEIAGEDVKKIAEITTQNAMNLFTLQSETTLPSGIR